MPDIINAWIPHGGEKENYPARIIVHCMAEYIDDGGLNEVHAPVFLNNYKLSAHALVDPTGRIFRCRHDNQRAWHARGNNINSLGIEFLVAGVHDYASFVDTIGHPWIHKEQYDAGLWQIKEWMRLYSIHPNNVIRHSDVSPGRKVDPGTGFPWAQLQQDIRE